MLSSADCGRQLSKIEEAVEIFVTIGRSLVFLGIGTLFDGRCRRRLLLERRSRRMKREVTRKVIMARPTAAPTTMPATVSLKIEWPAVDLDSCADKTDCVDVQVPVGLSDERLVGAIAWPELSSE